MTKRRSIVLVVVLVSLALCAALIAPLALQTGVRAAIVADDVNGLRHDLAVDSVVAVLPQMLESNRDWQRELDRSNQVRFTVPIGEVEVAVLLQDDTAKLPLASYFEEQRLNDLQLAMNAVVANSALPRLRLRTLDAKVFRWARCVEDLFDNPTDADLYGRLDQRTGWMSSISPIGRAAHIVRSSDVVIETIGNEIRPDLGRKLLTLRKSTGPDLLDRINTELELTDVQRRSLFQRITLQTERYSLLVRTTLEEDSRQHFLIIDANDPPSIIGKWEIAP